MIGPCMFEPAMDTVPDWLTAIDRPIVLVTTSSQKQADAKLVATAMAALADEPVHVVATLPAGLTKRRHTRTECDGVRICAARPSYWTARVCCNPRRDGRDPERPSPRGVPVCVVPFGRDHLEVARRVEVARCGTRLPANKLTTARLLANVRQAMTMTDGARRVAAGFAATGGVARGADLIEQRVLRNRAQLRWQRASRAAPVLARALSVNGSPTWFNRYSLAYAI